MAVIIPNIEQLSKIGYLSTYWDGDAGSQNRYATVYDLDIDLPESLLYNTNWPSRFSSYNPAFPAPLVFVSKADFDKTAEITNSYYTDERGAKRGHFYYTLKELEPEYRRLIEQKYKVEQGTTLYRVVKYHADLTPEVLDIVKSIPINTDASTLFNNPKHQSYLSPSINPMTGQRNDPPLAKQFSLDQSITIYNNRGVEEDFSLGVVVVADTNAVTLANRPQDRVPIGQPDPVQFEPPNFAMGEYQMRLQALTMQLQSMRGVDKEYVTVIIREAEQFLNDISADTRLRDEEKQGLSRIVSDILSGLNGMVAEMNTLVEAPIPNDVPDEPAPVEPIVMPAPVKDDFEKETEVIKQTAMVDVVKRNLFQLPTETYVFKKFRMDADYVESTKKVFTRGLWSGNVDSLSTFYTSSLQSNDSKQYYYSVLSSDDSDTTTCTTAAQFDVTYGNRQGSGSLHYHSKTSLSPSKAVFSQLSLMCLGDTTSSFSFGGTESDSIYAISFALDNTKDMVDPGNWQLTLSNLLDPEIVYHLIDDSDDVNQTYAYNNKNKDVYYIKSGTLGHGLYSDNSDVWGLFYPKLGLMVLNAELINVSCSFGIVSSSNVDGNNAYKLFESISSSASPYGARTTVHSFDARNTETFGTLTYFARATKDEYNYSNNPTWTSGSLGDPVYTELKVNPTTYITSIGLYNDNNELLAVGKFPYALRKSNHDDYTFTVRVKV